MSDKHYTELQVEVLWHGEKSCQIKVEGDLVYVPWSVIEDNGEDFKKGYKGRMYIETWFCNKEMIV